MCLTASPQNSSGPEFEGERTEDTSFVNILSFGSAEFLPSGTDNSGRGEHLGRRQGPPDLQRHQGRGQKAYGALGHWRPRRRASQ
jgi:hypothetical protein